MVDMLPVLVQSLLLAAGGILSVGSITLVILLLLSDRGLPNGLGYALGYTGAYTLIGITSVLVGYQATGSHSGERSTFVPILLLILGLILLFIAQNNWRKPPSEPGSESGFRFFAIVDRATPGKTFALGMLVTVVNVKNLAIFISAISVVHLSSLSVVEKVIAAVLVALVFCLSVIVPVLMRIE